ncbi:MAG: hypothetical protein ACR2HN_02040 [Tepidiformaceae bacterium]
MAAARLVVVALGLGAFLGVGVWYGGQQLKADREPGPPPRLRDAPAIVFAGSVVHYQIDEYLNYDYRRAGGLPYAQEQSRLFTDRWVEIGPDGLAKRSLTVAKKPDGSLWQEQYSDGQTTALNWFKRPSDGLACSQPFPQPPIDGSGLPVASSEARAAAGFREHKPSTIELQLAGLAGVAGQQTLIRNRKGGPTGDFSETRLVAFIEASTGQMRAELSIGTRSDGSEVVLESRKLSVLERVDSLPPYAIAALAACTSLSRPDEQPAPGGDVPGAVATPAPPPNR